MADDTSAPAQSPDSNNNDDYIKYLKSLLGKSSQAVVGEGNEGTSQAKPLEGYGAMAKGLPADPGAAAGVTPEGSPIDIVAGGAGAKLGGAMARDAAGIVGNQIGAIGSDIGNKAAQVAVADAPSAVVASGSNKFAPLLQGEGSGLIQKFKDLHPSLQNLTNGQDMLSAAQQITDRAAETGMKNPVTPDMLSSIKQKIVRESSQGIAADSAAANQMALRKQALAKAASGN